ncbi:MAG: DUF4249 domain-containing protein, partial [Bacteroidetes bacterium]|nr:DUF4249 domain-containing protein [Bacteroidota bacterium]
MHRIKIIHLYMMSFLMLSSCIKAFDPEIKGLDAKKYVVMGRITDNDSLQKVNVSLTSPVGKPAYVPVTGCIIKLMDDKGNEFPMMDMNDGNYTAVVDPAFVVPGVSFCLELVNPEGDSIVSTFDQISACPEIDSVYFLRKDLEGNIPGEFTLGIQFYLDLDASLSDSRYYLWEAYETFENHAEYPLEWYYDGSVHHVVPPDYSMMVCWQTLRKSNIFTLSTDKLTENKYHMYPLHYVNNKTSRLKYGYSLLIKQFAISEEAYIFWNQMRINSSQKGGLYEKQPLAVKGNLFNLNHPEKEVLGFFSASSLRQKRIFVHDVPDLPLEVDNYCSSFILRHPFWDITPRDYPAYLLGDEFTWYPIWLSDNCVDCSKLGGINVKPDF